MPIIQDMVNLLNPQNFRLTFISPEFDAESFQTAPHYGTKFMVLPFSNEFKLVCLKYETFTVETVEY